MENRLLFFYRMVYSSLERLTLVRSTAVSCPYRQVLLTTEQGAFRRPSG